MSAKKSSSVKTWVDPDDAPELTGKDFARGKKMIGDREVTDEAFREEVKTVRRGRPRKDVTKTPVSIRLSPEVVEYFKSTGRGWQTRMDDALKEYVASHRH